MSREVLCPACGGIVEAETLDELISLSKEHTRDAHRYDIPEEHVVAAAYETASNRTENQ
jgi:predicted small metal-binding protein